MQLPCLGLVGGRHLIGHGAGDGHEGLMLHGLPEEQIDIVGGGIVVHIVQAVGVGKVGAGAAQLLRPLVHQLHKGLTVSARMSAASLADTSSRQYSSCSTVSTSPSSMPAELPSGS